MRKERKEQFDNDIRLEIPQLIEEAKVNMMNFYRGSQRFFSILNFYNKPYNRSEFIRVLKQNRPDQKPPYRAYAWTTQRENSPMIRIKYPDIYKTLIGKTGIRGRRDHDIMINEDRHLEDVKENGPEILKPMIHLTILHELSEL